MQTANKRRLVNCKQCGKPMNKTRPWHKYHPKCGARARRLRREARVRKALAAAEDRAVADFGEVRR